MDMIVQGGGMIGVAFEDVLTVLNQFGCPGSGLTLVVPHIPGVFGHYAVDVERFDIVVTGVFCDKRFCGLRVCCIELGAAAIGGIDGVPLIERGDQVFLFGAGGGREGIHPVEHRQDLRRHFVRVGAVVVGAHRKRFAPICHGAAAVLLFR